MKLRGEGKITVRLRVFALYFHLIFPHTFSSRAYFSYPFSWAFTFDLCACGLYAEILITFRSQLNDMLSEFNNEQWNKIHTHTHMNILNIYRAMYEIDREKKKSA